MAKTFPASETISPSVRLIERDFSAYGPGFSLCKGAMVGFCSKGQFNIPTLVRSRDELFTKFGFPNPEVGSHLIYAAIEFLKQGNRLYIVRVGVTDEGDENFAQTALVAVPSAGTAAQIFIPAYTGGSANSYTSIDGVTHYLRIKVNDYPHVRMLGIPSDYTGSAIVSADTTDDTIYTVLAAQAKDDDPFVISQVTTGATALQGIYIKTRVNGVESKIELVSSQNDVYSSVGTANGGGLGINTAAKTAIVLGTNTQYPLNSSVANTWNFTALASLKLKVVVYNSGDDTIDGVVQTISIPTGDGCIYTDQDVVDEINDKLNGRLGGFYARLANTTLVNAKFDPNNEDFTGDKIVAAVLGETANTIILETFHRGRNAKILVKADSTADTVLGFSNVSQVGATYTTDQESSPGVNYTAAEAGYAFGTATSSETSFTVYASSPGDEGDNTQVLIARDLTSGSFNINVYFHGLLVESFNRMNKDAYSIDNPRNLEYWINGLSQYIVVEDNTDTEEGPAPATYSLVGGTNGIPTNVTEQTALIVGDEFLSTGLYSLAEPEKIDIDLVSVPGISTTQVWMGVQDLCENQRADCLGIVDPPMEMPPWEVIAWHNGLHPLNDVKLDTSFLALYWPWLKVRDSVNKINVWIPPSGPVMGQIAYSESISYAWYAPAGLKRGILDQVLELEYHAYLAERDSMYGFQNAVNTITQFPDTGIVIWGQKTLQRRMTALDRVNVRRLMFYLEKRISLNAKYFLFEPNDATLRMQFKKMCETICGYVKNACGMYDYIVICDETLNTDEVIDRNELRARIGVQPTKAAEFMFLEFTIHRKGSFEESEPLK